MMRDGLKEDALLVVADLDDQVGKKYRTTRERRRAPILLDWRGSAQCTGQRKEHLGLDLPAVS